MNSPVFVDIDYVDIVIDRNDHNVGLRFGDDVIYAMPQTLAAEIGRSLLDVSAVA